MPLEIHAHIIHEKRGLISQPLLHAVPRVGDEVRLNERTYLRVTRVIWVLDEPESRRQRVNIGVTDVVSEPPKEQA